jgi:Predicted periplasmic or secreted lipoprotein
MKLITVALVGGITVASSFAQSAQNEVSTSERELTPTSTRTNRVIERQPESQSSSMSTTNSAPDKTAEQTDRQLLTTIRQTVSTELSALATGSGAYASGNSTLPISFIVRNGEVELSGIVPTEKEKQRIKTIVEGVPGVTEVIDQLQVGQIASVTGSGALQPTSSRTNNVGRSYSVTNQPGNTRTNLLPTGRTNSNPRSAVLPRPGAERPDSPQQNLPGSGSVTNR